MANERILIVEDDRNLSFIMRRILENNEYEVWTAGSVQETNDVMDKQSFDLIILDMMLPDGMGTDICRNIRLSSACPILFASCLNDKDAKIEALELGGDDYITKPIDFEELLARIRANIRRSKKYTLGRTVSQEERYENIIIDKNKHEVYVESENGERSEDLKLSPTEYNILLSFFEKPGELMLYHEIYKKVWGADDLGDASTVMVHVSNLRKKLGESGKTLFKTVRSVGYIFGKV